MPASHQLAAILFTDIVSYTAIMQHDEEQARVIIKRHNSVLEKIVAAHHGEVVNYYGDGSLCIFSSATESVRCAVEIQKELQSDPIVPLRIGLHVGEIFFEDGKAIGDGVNVASRIQSLGQANTILFSRDIFDKIKNHSEFKAVSLGHFDFKNVDESLEVFAFANEGFVVPKKEKMEGKLKEKKKKNSAVRNLVIAAAVLIVALGSYFLYSKYLKKEGNAVEKSIAVLPFKNLSGDTSQEYFSEGMMDEILNHLYKMGGLNVISKTSSMAYRGSKKTSKQIAEELGVASLLEGSVQKNGDHIRIIVQLINGKTDEHVWAETYDREFKDVFAVQSDIAQQVAASLKVKINPGVKQRIEKRPTENTEAYNLYLQAIDLNLPFDPDNPFKKSIALLEAAVTLDSTFAQAYSELAARWVFKGLFNGGLSAAEVLKNAEPLLQRSLQLNSELARTHVYIAVMNLWYKWDFETVQSEYQEALQLNPSNFEITGGFFDFLVAMGRFGEAWNVANTAFIKDSSIATANHLNLAFAYFHTGKPEQALQMVEKIHPLIEKDPYVLENYIKVNVYAGAYKNALTAFEKNRFLFGSNISNSVWDLQGLLIRKRARTIQLINF
jgi:TolB-like protein